MHSFNSCLIHCVFSTKERQPWLASKIRERLWPYLGGIARENEMKALAIGGVTDHVHLLLSLPPTLSVSKAMQLLKGNSSKWLRETFPELCVRILRGRKGLAPSASACLTWRRQFITSRRRRNIIANGAFVRNWKFF
jgi:REP element-mobilizing transposase RayT